VKPAEPPPRAYRATLWVAAVASALLARYVRHRCLGDVPHVQDEFSYLLQAKTMALGRLAMPPLRPIGAFSMWFVEDRNARFGIFPPGWPSVLALAVPLRVIDWVNPLLHGATVLVVARATRRAFGTACAACAAALYAFSPQAILLAASLMSHTLVALAGAAVGAVLVVDVAAVTLDGVLAGALACMAVLARPLCAVVLATVFGMGAALRWRRGRPLPRRTLGAVLIGFALGSLLLTGWNLRLTGDAWRFPQTLYFDTHLPPAALAFFHYGPGCNSLGFGEGHGCDDGISGWHTPRNALENTGDNLRAWGLLLGAGPVVPLLALFAAVRRRDAAHAVLLAAPLAAMGLYGLYWYAGICYGARFYHAAVPFVVAAAASGLLSIPFLRSSPRRLTGVVALVVAANALVLRAASAELSDGYWGVDRRFASLKQRWQSSPALVMVAFDLAGMPDPSARPKLFWTTPFLRAGFWMPNVTLNGAVGLNGPLLDDRVLFSRFHPAYVEELRRRFPDRSLWLYVATADGSRDHVEPWNDRDMVSMGLTPTPPADNFDGYRLDAPAPPEPPPL
jgi:hypothetical protein